jgi:hypothetical protein
VGLLLETSAALTIVPGAGDVLREVGDVQPARSMSVWRQDRRNWSGSGARPAYEGIAPVSLWLRFERTDPGPVCFLFLEYLMNE